MKFMSLPVSEQLIGSNPLLLWLIVIGVAALLTVLLSFAVAASHPFRKNRGCIPPIAAVLTYLALILQIGIFVLAFRIYSKPAQIPVPTQSATQSATLPVATSSPEETTVPPTTAVPETTVPAVVFAPGSVNVSDPGNWNMTWEIQVGEDMVTRYDREELISFGDPEDYFALPGIATFRGNNYRNSATYGTADITEGTMTKVWSKHVGFLDSAEWIGCGWTGQPLIVQWDEETKQLMNIYDKKKAKEGLVEVIYAKMDGYIHFYDLEDGTATRDPIFMKMVFKGSGALDPRGYPVLYVGGGLDSHGQKPRMYAVSLIDGTILWEYGNKDDFALRNWAAYDSSPMVDAETDTLIWPGENGVLYSIKLNTDYDKEAGTISMDPVIQARTRYSSNYSENEDRYLGYEPSASIVDHYLYISENGGLFQCIDINTMELVWAQDTLDDSNSSPLFDWGEDGNGYIYTAPSLHWTQDNHHGDIPIFKINAQTGEIVWTHVYDCVTYDGCSGGVQSSPLLGKVGTDIEDLIIYSVGRTPGPWEGFLVALDKETGEVVWEISSGNYTWSSPVALYTEDGRSYLFLANASGVCRLIEGSTGEVLQTLSLKQTVEASPVVYGNMVILGTREGVFGIRVD